MRIEEYRVSELVPYANNAKLHDEQQIRNVANSITKFGWVQPLVIDNEKTVIIGHCRLAAAQLLQLEKVPCIKADDLTPEETRKLRIIDNRTNESPWDYDLLSEEVDQLEFNGFAFDFDSIEGAMKQKLDTAMEYSGENFRDEKFKCCCPECGFLFNP